MAAGDVTVTIVSPPLTTAAIDSALTSLRTLAGANGKILMASSGAGDLILAGIEEA